MKSSEEVLQRNDLVYKVLPSLWVLGIPIGNGEVGGMVWIEDETKVIITLDNVWAWDHRQRPIEDPSKNNYRRIRDLVAKGEDYRAMEIVCPGESQPTKTYVGRLVVNFGQKISGKGRLHLHNAEVELEVRTETGDAVHLRILAWANLPGIMVEHDHRAAIKDLRIERIPSDRLMANLPDYERGNTGEIQWIRQEIPQSPSLALALLPGNKQSYVTAQVSREGEDPVQTAIKVLEKASSNPAGFLDSHRIWWQNFWSRSSIQLPDPQIESFWYMGLYLLASASREGGAAVSLHGPWQPDNRMPPARGFYIFDFYPQYWGIYAANHLELGTAYYDHFFSILPRLKEETKKFYGWEGVFVPGFMSIDGSWIFILPVVPVHAEVLLWPGTSAWVAQSFWWHYLYSRDEDFLKRKAYPFMRECMVFYEGLLEKEDDGKYHLGLTYSPEWGLPDSGWERDDTLSLSLIRYLTKAMLEATKILRIDEPHQHCWQEILDNLAEYHKDETGLCLAEKLSYSRTHRHLSHLGPIYPCGDVNVDGAEEDRQLIETSLNNVVEKGYGVWAGWSFVWTSILASRAGRRQMAWWTLKQLDAFVSCNTFNLNVDWCRNGISTIKDTYCQDANMSAVAAVNEMLVQSWGGRIRIFPACPSHWREVRFDRLLCEGGVEASAVRSKGRTLGVKLKSQLTQRVRLLNPFDIGGGYIEQHLIRPDKEGDLLVDLKTGEGIWITTTKEINPRDLDEFVVERPEGTANPYGVKYSAEGLFSDALKASGVTPAEGPK